MGAVFFNERVTLGGFLGALLILAGVLLVTLRFPASSTTAATKASVPVSSGVSMLAAASDSAGKSKVDSDAETCLLPGGHLHSDVAAPDGVAVIRLHADCRALCPAQGGLASPAPAGEEEQQQLIAANAVSDAEADAGGAEPFEPGLLAQVAASAAAALGGELCPAGSTAMAVELSRQVSWQLGRSRAVSQLSRQPSQWLFGTTSAFLTAPGLPWELQPQAGQQQEFQPPQQQQATASVAPPSQQQRQPEGVNGEQHMQGEVQGLRQALLQSDSTPSSPVPPHQQQQ